MNNKFEQYKASNMKIDKFAKYHHSNFDQDSNAKEQTPDDISNILKTFIRGSSKNFLSEALGQVGRNVPIRYAEEIGRNAGQSALPFAENLPTGILEGLQKAYAGLIGGDFKGAPVSDEYGANFGRGVGQELGRGLVAAPVIAAGGALGGFPGALGATALSYGATTPGNLKERAIEGGTAAALPLAGKLIGGTSRAISNAIGRYTAKPKVANLEHAEQRLLNSKAIEQHLTNQASHNFGQSNPDRLLMTAKDKTRELEQGQKYVNNNSIFEINQMRPGQQTLSETEHNLTAINNRLKKALVEGEAHIQKLSNHLVNEIEGIPIMEPHPKTGLPRQVRTGGLREEVGKKYDNLEKDLPDLEIPGSVDTTAIEKEMKSLIGSKADISEAEKENIRTLLVKTHPGTKNKTISGKEFFRAYRSLRREEGKQRSKAFSGLSPKDHDEWITRANHTKKIYEDMESIIDKHFPKDTLKKLHQINHEYSTKIAPLHENPMYQQMLNHGRYSGNIIDFLSGTTKGNDILNNMIRNNPEYTRLTLGHDFAANPEKLLKPNQLLEPFKNVNLEISKLMNEQRAAHSMVEHAKQQEPLVQQVIKNREMQEQIKNINKQAKDIQAAINDTKLSKVDRDIKKQELEMVLQRRSKIKSQAKKIAGKLGYAGLYGGSAYLGTKLAQK